MLTEQLKKAGKTCPEEDIKFVATLFEHNTKGIPECESVLIDGQESYGFYFLFLKFTMIETDPEIFFQILKIDRKIDWVNLAHVEQSVFYFKAINVINDEKVTFSRSWFKY